MSYILGYTYNPTYYIYRCHVLGKADLHALGKGSQAEGKMAYALDNEPLVLGNTHYI